MSPFLSWRRCRNAPYGVLASCGKCGECLCQWQYPAYEAIAASTCGPDLGCICSNDNFFLTLEATILTRGCSIAEAQGEMSSPGTLTLYSGKHICQGGRWITHANAWPLTESLASTRRICVEAVPWLNDNRGPEIVAAITVLTLIATIAVALRLLARRISNLKFGTDDWLIVVALVSRSKIVPYAWRWTIPDLRLWSYRYPVLRYVSCHRTSHIQKAIDWSRTAVHNGFGKHMLMLDLPEITGFSKVSNSITHFANHYRKASSNVWERKSLIIMAGFLRLIRNLRRQCHCNQALRSILLPPHIPHPALYYNFHHYWARRRCLVHRFHLRAVLYLCTLKILLG